MKPPTETKPVTLAERRQAKIDALQAKQARDLHTAKARQLHDAIRPLIGKDDEAAHAATEALMEHLSDAPARTARG